MFARPASWTRCGLLAAAVLVLIGSTAEAGKPKTHDGFLLRLSAGGGFGTSEITDGSDKVAFSGAAGDVNFAIGAAIGENLILHGTLAGWSASDPDIEVNNVTFGTSNVTLTVSGIGPGITYYVMPANLYLSGSILAAAITAEFGSTDFDSNTGIAFDATVGKEWWVGDGWGLGLAGGLNVHSIGVDNLDDKFTGTAFTVRFSATMN